MNLAFTSCFSYSTSKSCTKRIRCCIHEGSLRLYHTLYRDRSLCGLKYISRLLHYKAMLWFQSRMVLFIFLFCTICLQDIVDLPMWFVHKNLLDTYIGHTGGKCCLLYYTTHIHCKWKISNLFHLCALVNQPLCETINLKVLYFNMKWCSFTSLDDLGWTLLIACSMQVVSVLN